MWRLRLQCKSHRLSKYAISRRYVMNRGGGSKDSNKPGMFQTFFNNVRQGLEKNEEMQQSIKKLQEEASRLGRSQMLLSLRARALGIRLLVGRAFVTSYSFMRQQWTKFSSFSLKTYRNASQSKPVEQAVQSAKDTAKKVSQQTEELSQTEAYRTVARGVNTVKSELLEDIITESQPYKSPEVLLKRSDPARSAGKNAAHFIEPNEDVKGVTVHKQSKWLSYWSQFRDTFQTNPVSNALYSMKIRYDESDNILVRTSRVVTDRVEDAVSGVVTQSDMAETLGEIAKVDPNFTKEDFLNDLQFEIIPTILEAFLKAKLDVLQDWSHEAAFNVLKAHIDMQAQRGTRVLDSRVLDIRHVDILVAKLMDKVPVFVITFVAQQIGIIRDKQGNIVEGDEDNISNVQYVWALSRDQTIYNPKTAWRLSEFAIHSENRLLV
ncbi:mitochondrial import inner membrane translocase subunit TIM44-like [Dysidea avara]|uniref:mitochondrial import inner membrane translocase subunit TIM44-like n=1 Tax=Dysidea avara TaxID=196820 RepID=UPI00332E5C10